MSVELASRFVRVDVRYWPLADIVAHGRNVRSWTQTGRCPIGREGLQMTLAV